jgi:hypothetical protein
VSTELDLRLEAAAASEYRDNSRDDDRLLVPEVYWAGTGRKVVTLEWVEGLPPEPEPLAAAGLDLPEIAVRLIRTFLRQALHDGYFHADMHQGNIRVGADGTLIIAAAPRSISRLAMSPPTAMSKPSRKACGPSPSRSTARRARRSRWRGCWGTCWRPRNASAWRRGPS